MQVKKGNQYNLKEEHDEFGVEEGEGGDENELEKVDDAELEKLLEDFPSMDEDLYNTKKVNQYKTINKLTKIK